MKMAIISDIHANLPALEAVLADISRFGADQVYCLGDLTDAAPWPNEVIQKIRSLRIPTIMGNHDERIAFDLPVFPLAKHSPAEQAARADTIQLTKNTITAENKHFLQSLPALLQLRFAHLNILLAHGSPHSNETYLYETHPEAALVEMMDAFSSNVLIIGHTHLPYIRSINNDQQLVINTGSVGRTREAHGKAAYLQLTIHNTNAPTLAELLTANIRSVEYDIMQTVQAIRKSAVPDFYADFLSTALPVS
ncbi:metallophosphoesterase [Chitinophaga sp. HK235]|uniref:metallophosphoesterase family protein n=1 Tax=Chitinophaga sp. HK235 TaxID=2952571 RepID=UPI001BA7771B|nr:metallophosphoesterase family protein [Chitinophaga sp. HK235]